MGYSSIKMEAPNVHTFTFFFLFNSGAQISYLSAKSLQLETFINQCVAEAYSVNQSDNCPAGPTIK